MHQPGCRWSLSQCALHILERDGLPAPEWPARSQDSAWRSTSPIGRCLAPQVEDMGQGEYQHTWQQYINAFAEALIAAGADDPQSPAGRRVVSVTVLSEARQHASTRYTGFYTCRCLSGQGSGCDWCPPRLRFWRNVASMC